MVRIRKDFTGSDGDLSGSRMLSDPDGYAKKKSAEQILADLV